MILVTETAAAEGLIFVATCTLTACICFRPKLMKILLHHQLEQSLQIWARNQGLKETEISSPQHTVPSWRKDKYLKFLQTHKIYFFLDEQQSGDEQQQKDEDQEVELKEYAEAEDEEEDDPPI